MAHLLNLWSNAVDHPVFTVIVLLASAMAAAALLTWIEILQEGLGAKATTVDDLHRDAYTDERQHRLRGIQGGRNDRGAS